MQKLMSDLDIVFKMISKIPVSEDNVDRMAVARDKLRHVYAELKKIDESKLGDTESAGD